MKAMLNLRKAIIRFIDSLFVCSLAFLWNSVFPVHAWAYIDPSVMTYTIQALAGVAVALSAALGMVWRRGRRVVERLLDIDPNAKRVTEGDVSRIDKDNGFGLDALREATTQAMNEKKLLSESASSSRRPLRPFRDKRPFAPAWKTRFAYGTLVASFLIFTVFFCAPIEIVNGATSSIIFGIKDVWWLLALADCALILGAGLLISVFRKGAFAIVISIVFTLGLLAYIQALILNEGLPAANGAAIFWGDYMSQQIIGAVIWGLMIIAAIVYAVRNKRRAQGIALIGSVLLLAVQIISMVVLLCGAALSTSSQSAEVERAVMTEDGLFTVSKTDNVIVFVLDTFDDAYLRRIMKDDPTLLDEFTGFTDYQNCTGTMIPTRFAVPQLLTGQMPNMDEPYSVYAGQRYARSTFLEDMNNAGYDVGIYTDSLGISDLSAEEQQAINASTLNIHDLPTSAMDAGPTLYSLFQMALYRDAPWVLKWAFWYYTDQINSAYARYEPDNAPEETIYVIDDMRYYDRLLRFGLTVDQNEKGAFRFIHLLGSHYPFNYDEEVTYLGQDESDVFRQSRGALAIVKEYLQQLKELELYAGSTIIVTADHGYWTITEEPIEDTSNPIMFVKPAQTPEEAEAPFAFSNKPVSQLDLQATILDAMGLDYSSYAQNTDYPGYSIFDEIDPDRVRLYLTTDSEPDLSETQFREYMIEGDARDFSNWSETGRVLDARS